MRDFSCLAVDIGAESGRVMEIAIDANGLALREHTRFANGPVRMKGRLYWDLDALFAAVVNGLARAVQAGARPQSLGIDTWGVDVALLMAGGLSQPYAYRDERVLGEAERLESALPRAERYAVSGIQELCFNTIFQLSYDCREAPERFQAARHWLFIPDALHYLLTGEAANEYTVASTSGLLDARTRRPSPRLLTGAGLPDLFAPIVEPGHVLGPLRRELSLQTGLPVCMPLVAVATHDTASAVVAMPFAGVPGEAAYLSSGTWSLLGIESHEAFLTPEAERANLTHEGGVEGRLRLLKNCMGLWILQRLRAEWPEADGPASYDVLAEEAAAAPSFAAFVNPDDPRFLNPSSMRVALEAALRETDQPVPVTRGAFVRAILESLAFRYRAILDEIRAVTRAPIRQLHILGGGSRNALLNQLAADATGLPVIAGPSEATAIGNAVMQAVSSGLWRNLDEARAFLAAHLETTRYEPRPSPALAAAWERFRALPAKETP